MNLLIILHPSKNENTTRGFCLIPGDITASGKQRASRGQSSAFRELFHFQERSWNWSGFVDAILLELGDFMRSLFDFRAVVS
jgi:hypothetical protein